MAISTVSLSTVSEMAMVPDSECSTPTLMGAPWASAAGAKPAAARLSAKADRACVA